MMRKVLRIMTYVAVILLSVPVNGQCKYCNNYEDFLAGRWTKMDTVYAVHHSKGRQFWGGGNDYTLKTDNRSMNEKLKKEVLVVMQADTLFLNCRNLNYEKTYFGNGYTRAMRIGERSLLFVNKLIGRNAQSEQIAAAVMFGAIGASIAGSSKRKQQVCYVISCGADKYGQINIRLIDDDLMNQMISGHEDLHEEYYSEKDVKKRLLANHIVPILEKAGLFDQAKQKTNKKKES